MKNKLKAEQKVRKWRHGRLPYEFDDETYSENDIETLEAIFDTFNQKMKANNIGVKVVRRTSEESFISIEKGTYLNYYSSFVGRVGGAQKMVLQDLNGIVAPDYIVFHELMHALGYQHEHSRTDRLEHVEIHWENVREGFESNFAVAESFFGIENTVFDFDSLMLYSPFSQSKNDEMTLSKLNGDGWERNFDLSNGDYHEIRRDYRLGVAFPDDRLCVEVDNSWGWNINGFCFNGPCTEVSHGDISWIDPGNCWQ